MIIVTGGAGFIGSHLIEKINELGFSDIIIVDWMGDSGKWRHLVDKQFYAIIQPQDFFTWFKQQNLHASITGVFHLGACTDTTETNVDYLLKNNTEYSKQLADFCFERNIPLIYASSAATYGDGGEGYSDNHELTPLLQPLNPYGWSKHLFDLWLLKSRPEKPWVGFKFFNVYGPNEGFKDKMSSKVFSGYKEFKSGGKIRLFKSDKNDVPDGGQSRDFIYVGDVVDCMWNAFANYKKVKSQIVNLGTGTPRTFFDLAKITLTTLGSKNPMDDIQWIEMPENLKGKYQYYTKADTSKLLSLKLLENGFTSLESGITKTITKLQN